MEPDKEILEAVAQALTEGQGDFDEGELVAAYEEIADALRGGDAATLVLEGRVALTVNDGTVLYSVVTPGEDPPAPTSLEVLIERHPPPPSE
jgi:hypothetical protein